MKINLGCGNDVQKGYINHDLTKHREDIDICFDLNDKDWSINVDLETAFIGEPLREKNKTTFFSKEIDEIRAWDVIEHINDPINFMDNCWDLLKPGGVLAMKACGWQNPNFWVDITHKKGYDIKTFDYFDPSTEIGREYGYYSSKRWKILEKHYDKRKNVIIKLTPIK